MKLFAIFGLIFVVLLEVECEDRRVTQLMKDYKVIYDIVDRGPDEELHVYYEDNNVLTAHQMTPSETKIKPDEVEWNADNEAYYTLIFTTPDAPDPNNRTLSEFIHWIVVNIPGDDIDSGDELVEYVGPSPLKNKGLSRYVFLVYKQKGKQTYDEEHIDKYSFKSRTKFSTVDFYKKHNMGPSLQASTFFRAQYDPYSDELNSQYKDY